MEKSSFSTLQRHSFVQRNVNCLHFFLFFKNVVHLICTSTQIELGSVYGKRVQFTFSVSPTPSAPFLPAKYRLRFTQLPICCVRVSKCSWYPSVNELFGCVAWSQFKRSHIVSSRHEQSAINQFVESRRSHFYRSHNWLQFQICMFFFTFHTLLMHSNWHGLKQSRRWCSVLTHEWLCSIVCVQ